MRIVALVCLVAGTAAAQRPSPLPVAPSTGREHPTVERRALSPEEQAAALKAGLEQSARGECAKAYVSLTAGIVGGAQPLAIAKDSAPAYAALALCASRTQHHLVALRASREVYKFDAATPLAYLVPESEIALGLYKEALEDLKSMSAARPNDARLALVHAAGDCKLELWPLCLTLTAQAAPLLDGLTDADKPQLAAQLHALRAEGLFHTGKFDESTAELTMARTLAGAAADPAWDKRLKRNEIVKAGKLAVEPLFDKSVPLGVYHLLGQVKGTRPLVMLKLYNFDDKPRNVRIEIEIPGVTDKKVTTKMLMPAKREIAELTPPLRADFPVASVRAERPAQLSIKVSVGADALYEKSYPVTILPRDTLPMSQRIDADLSVPTPGFIAAWVTPNAKAVDAFLQKAKARVDGTFAGEQTATMPQVRALWDELQAAGMSYVNDPAVLADFGYAQRTRLPTEVLDSKNAQCLEGTIVFATLLEAIGLHPIIVRVPGHAFVGWRLTAKDGIKGGDSGFVETTLVHKAKFEDAVRFAVARVVEERKAGHFARGIYGPAFMLDLAELRKLGFLPQPVE